MGESLTLSLTCEPYEHTQGMSTAGDNSGKDVLGVTKYFLIGFKAHSTLQKYANMTKNLWLRSS